MLQYWFLASSQAWPVLSISGQMQIPFLLALSISEVAAEQFIKFPSMICFHRIKDGDLCDRIIGREGQQRPGAAPSAAISCSCCFCGLCILALAVLYYCCRCRCYMRLFSPSFSGLGASSQPPLTKLAYQALTTMMTHGSTDTWRRGIGVGTEWPLSILSISLAVRTHRVFMKRVLALAGKALLCDLGWHAWQRCRTANKMVVQQAQVQAEAAGLSGTVSERVLKCLPLPVQNTRPVCSESAVSGHRPAQLSSGCTAADMGVSGTGTDAGLGVRPRSPATTTDTGQPNGLRPMGPAADVVSCAELQFGAGSSLTNGGAGPIRQPGATSGGRPMGHLGQHSNAGENGAQTSAVDAAPRRRTGAVALAASSAGCAVTATTATNPRYWTQPPPYRPFSMRPRHGCGCRPLHMSNNVLLPGLQLVPTALCRESTATATQLSYMPRAQLVSVRIEIQGVDPEEVAGGNEA